MFDRQVRSALFVDYDNVAPRFANFAFSGRIGNWLAWLEAGEFDPSKRRRKFLRKAVFMHPVHESEQPAFHQFGFVSQTCVYASGLKREQSAVDLHLAVDAIDTACTVRSLKEAVILATDTDYVPVIALLKKKGIRTTIMVFEGDRSETAYNGIADLVISVDEMNGALSYVRTRDGVVVPDQSGAPSARGRGKHPTLAAPTIEEKREARKAKKKASPPPPPALGKTKPVPTPVPINMEVVAQAVLAVAKSQPNLPVGRARVIKELRRIAPLTPSGPTAWYGRGTYEAVVAELASIKSELSVRTEQGGGVVLYWQAPPDAPSA